MSQIKGIVETQRNIEQAISDLHGKPMLSAFRSATAMIASDAKRLAPVDTGRLRASITPTIDFDPRGTKIIGIVGTNVSYAPAMETGTGTYANKPRVPKPDGSKLERWARRHGFKSGWQVANIIYNNGGVRGHFYMQNAFDQNKKEVRAMIEGAVIKIVGDANA